MLKDMVFYHLQENIENNYLGTRDDSLKTASKKVAHKTGEFTGNKIVDAVSQTMLKL